MHVCIWKPVLHQSLWGTRTIDLLWLDPQTAAELSFLHMVIMDSCRGSINNSLIISGMCKLLSRQHCCCISITAIKCQEGNQRWIKVVAIRNAHHKNSKGCKWTQRGAEYEQRQLTIQNNNTACHTFHYLWHWNHFKKWCGLRHNVCLWKLNDLGTLQVWLGES